MQTAEGSSNDVALSLAEYTLGVALLSRDAAADRHRGLELMVHARDIWLRERAPFLVPVADLWAARERARRGDRDAAIAVMRQAVDELHEAGRLVYGVWGTGVLVETLLERGAEGELAEAQEAIDGLANLRADHGSAMREITLLRLRALLARARGDERRLPRLGGVAIARWRNRLASKDTSRRPKRCEAGVLVRDPRRDHCDWRAREVDLRGAGMPCRVQLDLSDTAP